jgi:hypothetical protein
MAPQSTSSPSLTLSNVPSASNPVAGPTSMPTLSAMTIQPTVLTLTSCSQLEEIKLMDCAGIQQLPPGQLNKFLSTCENTYAGTVNDLKKPIKNCELIFILV